MKVWGLFSSRVDTYSSHDLLDLFTQQAVAEAVRDGLTGMPVQPGLSSVWEDDEDFPDLYVRPMEVRP